MSRSPSYLAEAILPFIHLFSNAVEATGHPAFLRVSGAWIAGLIVLQPYGTGPLFHYDTLSLIRAGTMITCVALLFAVDRQVKPRANAQQPVIPG